GDEIGMGDNIDLFDRNGVRTPMQWTGEPGAGFSSADPAEFWAPLIDDETYGYQKVNVEAQRAEPGSLFHQMKYFVTTRKANPVLGWGSCEFLGVNNKAILAYLRQTSNTRLLIVCNLSGQAQEVSLPLADFVGHRPVDILSRQTLPIISQADYPLSLQPYQYHWLRFG
ncbi:MAG TPA: alpha-glucosidase C-terminal domain-containing protein, partial [Anaerolineae bacterium]|nr:alpha-glucosidase C-terminal domain-containing protein [Anaerolineae bacterium]